MTSGPVKTYNSSTNSSTNGIYSPRNVGVNDSLTRQASQPQPEEKPKLTKKPQGMVEEG